MNLKNFDRMTAEELSLVFCISEETVRKLAKTKQIPCLHTKNRMHFNFIEVVKHLKMMEEGSAL